MPGGKHILGMPKGKHVFGTVKVGEKGQIVIPKEARTVFGIRPGDTLLVLGDEARGIRESVQFMLQNSVQRAAHVVKKTLLDKPNT